MKFSTAISVSALVGLLASWCTEQPQKVIKVKARTHWNRAIVENTEQEGPPLVTSNPLPVTPRVEEGYYSCWSTCAEMIMEFLGGGNIGQCEQASVAFANFTCCGDNGALAHGICDSQWIPEFEKWGFDRDYRYEQPLSWSELTTEINEGRPFAFSWVENYSTSPINHMLVVIGYDESNGEKTVMCLDPHYDRESDVVYPSFSQYDGSSDEDPHPHISDYFRIRPITVP